MSALTLTASELTDLVAPVVPHASTDKSLPLLGNVLIRTAGGCATALATDRYTMGLQRITPKNGVEDGFSALVATATLARIRSIFRATREHDPVLTLTADGDTLTVAAADVIDVGWLTGATLTFGRGNWGDFPKLDRLFREALETPVPPECHALAVNPAFLARFAKASRHGEPVVARPTREHKPWLVRVGDDFLGLIAQVRFADAVAEPSGWDALLDPADTKEKAA